MKGFVDYVDDRCVRGWCECNVEIIVDRRFVLDPDRIVDRQDLVVAGLVGKGFELDLASAMPGYTPCEIIVRPFGYLHPLPGGYLKLGVLRPFQYVESNSDAHAHNERLLAGCVRGVCLFTSRSGGTYLADLIRSHSRAYAFAEPVEGFVRGGRAAFSEWLSDYFLLPSSIEYPTVVRDPSLMFMTTKIRSGDIELMTAFNYYGVRYLRLYRENVLKQAISHMTAKKIYDECRNYNILQSVAGVAQRSRSRIFVDPGALIHGVEHLMESERAIDEMILKYAKGDVMSISYEELTSGNAGIFKVFDYFGLDREDVAPRHIKINSDDLADVVENYDDLFKVISRTRFAHFLA